MADPEARLLPFAPEDYEDRLDGLRDAMEMHGLDACVLTSPRNVAYYCGLVQTGLGPSDGLVVTRSDSVILGAARAGSRAGRRGHGDWRTVDEGQRDDVWRVAASVAGTGKAIGCEADHLTLMQSEKLNAFLAPRRGVDIALAAMQQRMVKSGAEITLIRMAASVADLGAAAMCAAIRPASAECDIAWAGRRAMQTEIARLLPQAEYHGTSALLQSGPGRGGAASPVTGRRLKTGDVLGLTTLPMLHGYGAVLTRTLGMGQPDPAGGPCRQAALDLHVLGKSLLKPGTSCGQIAGALLAALADHPLLPGISTDFGGGLPGEPLLALRAGCETVLEPGMVLCLSPLCSAAQGPSGTGGFAVADMLLITEDGCEVLTRFSHDAGAGPAI